MEESLPLTTDLRELPNVTSSDTVAVPPTIGRLTINASVSDPQEDESGILQDSRDTLPISELTQYTALISKYQVSQGCPASNGVDILPDQCRVPAASRCKFLNLPGEIRNMIYRYTFPRTRTVGVGEVLNGRWDWQYTLQEQHPQTGQRIGSVDLSILRTNKLINREASALFFSENTHVVILNESDWLSDASPAANINKVRLFTLEFGDACMESPDFYGVYSRKRADAVNRAAHILNCLLDNALSTHSAAEQIAIHLPSPCLEWLEQVVTDYVRECHVPMPETYSADDLVWSTSFLTYFWQLGEEVILHGLFPFLDRGNMWYAMLRLKSPQPCTSRYCSLGRCTCKGVAFKVVLNNSWWDELEEDYAWEGTTMRNQEEFPRAVFAILHSLWKAPICSNGRLLWEQGMEMEPGYERDAHFSPPTFEKAVEKAISSGWITIDSRMNEDMSEE